MTPASFIGNLPSVGVCLDSQVSDGWCLRVVTGSACTRAGLSQLPVTMEKTAKAMKDAIVGERGPKFGCGKKQKEIECDKIHVFMRCILSSGVAIEPRRALLSPAHTISDARTAYINARGRPIQQEHVRDENGYVLETSLHSQPLAQFSNDCKLNLDFSYSEDISVSAMKKSVDASHSTWAWIRSKF